MQRLDMPSLPNGYRWVVTTDRNDFVVVLLQKNFYGLFWYTKDRRWPQFMADNIRPKAVGVRVYLIEDLAKEMYRKEFNDDGGMDPSIFGIYEGDSS